MNRGESHAETLVSEVKEESGYIVKPDTTEEFGRVLRRERGSKDQNEIFEQENFYYLSIRTRRSRMITKPRRGLRHAS